MGVTRREASEKIFRLLADYVLSADSTYGFDLSKCYIDFQQFDKCMLDTMSTVYMQDFIPNANFSIVKYNGKNMLVIIGETKINFSDAVLIQCEVDLAMFVYSVFVLNANVSHTKEPIEVYNNVLCQPEDEAYHGHNLDDLIECFENIVFYEIPETSSLSIENPYDSYAYYLLKKLQVESLKWEDRTLDILEEIILNGNNKIPFHNIVLALLANQWNHSFLETYRCIEHLFHVIRLEEFYNVLNTPLTMLDVAREIEDKISWRPNEESAISDIFKEISNLHITSELEQVKNKYDNNIKIERWYYKQRNSIAHYRAIHEPLKLDNSEWNIMIRFNLMVVEHLYEKYKNKI